MSKITFLILITTLFSCSAQEKPQTYYKGREFKFKVEILKNDSLIKEHEINLTVTDGLRAKIMTGGQIGIQYNYVDIKDPKTKKSLIETTGAIDDGKRVFIHPPRMAYMEFAEIPPMPDIRRKTSI